MRKLLAWAAIALMLLGTSPPALATITSPTATVTDTATGSSNTFNYGFLIPFQADGVTPAVTVQEFNPNTLALTTLTPSQYTISGVGNPTGGLVSINGTTLAAGIQVNITRSYAYTQTTSVPNIGFFPHTVEQVADSLEYQIQQLLLTPPVTSFDNRTGQVVLNSTDVDGALGFVPLNPANNLSDLASASTARTNLGLGTFATQNFATPPAIGATTPAPGTFSALTAIGQTKLSALAGGGVQCLQIDGTGVVLGAGTTCVSGGSFSPANKDVYVSTMGSDTNSGLSWGFPKLTLQAAVNAAAPNGTVHVGSGTYSLTAALAMQPKVRLLCVDGAVITQPNGQNLSMLVDFSTNTANGASIQNCTLDGNRANNADNANVFIVYVGPANDAQVVNNTIQNGNGYGIDVSTGLRPVISDNTMSNFFVTGIFVSTGTAFTKTQAKITYNKLSSFLGQHAIGLANSDQDTVEGNIINTPLQTGMTVNTSGTTVTLTAGPNFSTISPGQFIILAGGEEYNIASITDNTHLVVTTTTITHTGVPAAVGSGDLIGLTAVSYTTVANNKIFGGVGGGIVLSNFLAGESAAKNNIIGNILSGQGEGCIELESENAFGTTVQNNQIRNNTINNCGVGTTAVASNTLYGIALIDFNPNTLLNTFIDGNYIVDDQGSPTTQNWLFAGTAAGQVFVGKNYNVGTISNGVANGIRSVSLSASWGSTATVTGIVSYGNSFVFTANSSGTGQAATPTATVSMNAGPTSNPPVMNCKQTGGNGPINQVFGEEPGLDSAPGTQVFLMVGTANAGGTYQFLCTGN